MHSPPASLSRRFANPVALALVGPVIRKYGITRVAQQTGLDVVGLPCYAAIRPNARTLAVNQGKGRDDIAARLSAIMEAVEFAIAEAPEAERYEASIEGLVARGLDWFVPAGTLPRGYEVDREKSVTWLEGRCLASGQGVMVPLDSAALSPRSNAGTPFSQSSNGLGAGFSVEEAVAHGLCEVVERDASSLWSMRSLRSCADTVLALGGIVDGEALECLHKVWDSGFQLRLFDLTSDLGMPVVMAFLWSNKPAAHFDVASGVCAHPDAQRAIAGAIQEAAQTRISNIAGARDDIRPKEYREPLPAWIAALIALNGEGTRPLPPPLTSPQFASLPARMGRTIAVPLTGANDGIVVVKVMCDRTEDRATNTHWRPGHRAIRAMMSI